MASSISISSKQENSEIGREAKFVDCEQSVFSLKIRRVLRHGAFWHKERFKLKRDWGETIMSLPSRAYALVSRGSYHSDFEENKRLLAVYQ